MNTTGLGSRTAAISSPLASSAVEGATTFSPGECMNHALGVLGVVRAAGEAAAGGQADGDVHRQALAVVHLAGDVDELVEAAGDEVGELHLGDRPQALDGRADRAADDRRLGQRRVHHALRRRTRR